MSSGTQKQSPCRRLNLLTRLNSVSDNGLSFNGIYVPIEIVLMILTLLDAKDLLQSSMVCRKWLNVVRSDRFWYNKFKRYSKKEPKKLPWYVYFAYFHHGLFDRNLLKNGNGEERFMYWMILHNGGDRFRVERFPVGAHLLPEYVEEFNGQTSCFATSYALCSKSQRIKLPPLCGRVLDAHKPVIYVSEWMAGRFDCACRYTLTCSLYGEKDKDVPPLAMDSRFVTIDQWEGREWSKVDMVLHDYPDGVENIIFQHEGCDSQYWGGHYGSKMAGGVVKILFDTVKEVAEPKL